MDKTQLLELVSEQLRAGTITVSDLAALSNPTQATPLSGAVLVASTGKAVSRNLINVFYGIGAIIVLSGIVILVAQHWNELGYAGRLTVTLGIGSATFLAGLLLRGTSMRVISQVFLTLAFVLLPLGVYVILHEAKITFTLLVQLEISMSLAILYLIAWVFSRHNVAILYTAFYGTWAYYSGILNLFQGGAIIPHHLLLWASIVAGASYLLIGYCVRGSGFEDEYAKERNSVRTLFYFFGSFAVLSGGIGLGGVWDLVYVAVVFGLFYLSVFLHSRAVLILSGLFLIGHLIHLTAKYFADSIGWPVALVISGFIVIGIGYATYYVHKKYLHA